MVIVGAGHVGGRAAQALREFGWREGIVLIGDEPHLPYERPPLSKGLLIGSRDGASCALRPPESYERDGITHVVEPALGIDTAERRIALTSGRTIAFGALLLATGGRPRRLAIPGADLPGVMTLRTLNDATALAARLVPGARILIVGGGFIGLEVAAAARLRGCEVVLVEGADRLMGRAVPEPIASRALALHRNRGVDVRLQTVPWEIAPRDDGALSLSLSDGSELTAASVVVGIGIEPAIELARDAGLACNRGILVDAMLATSRPGIHAAGDVAEFPSPLSGQPIRQESWYNAETQARTAARNMLDGSEAYGATPWLWSDQYDHVVQIAGEPALGVATIVRTPGESTEIHFHLDGEGSLVGASGFGPVSLMAREFLLARKLVERRLRPRGAELGDTTVALKSLLRAG
jgi:3-phenylpropionate/trans-cinnamate dioxygenase ferredoxin reductase subunit